MKFFQVDLIILHERQERLIRGGVGVVQEMEGKKSKSIDE